MSWAKLPSKWMSPTVNPDDDEEKIYPLKTFFVWRKDGSSSTAALMILIALSIKLNQSLIGFTALDGKRPATVSVTYDELQRMTGFARGPVGGAIKLLAEVGAIKRVKVGRANQYELQGVQQAGGWCQLPQAKLVRADGTLSIKAMERKRMTLCALKLYMVLMTLRKQKFNTASLSYAGITRWTGIRRSDIGRAIQMLIAWELVDVSEDPDERYFDENDRSNRYRIRGLGPMRHESEATA